MAAVWLRFGAELRRRWRAWLVLGLLVGIAGGVALAALAAARRTDAAYPRFLESQKAFDVLVANGRDPIYPFASFDLDEIIALPQVAEASRVANVVWIAPTPNGEFITPDNVTSLVPLDDGYGTRFNRLHMLEGRAPSAPDEFAPSFVAAEQFGLEVGDTLQAQFLTPEILEQFFEGEQSFDVESIPRIPIRVSGIAAAPGEFPPQDATAGNNPIIHFPQSFAHDPVFVSAVDVLAVRVRGGEMGTRAFLRELEARSSGRPVFSIVQADATVTTRRSVGVQADALRVVALLAAVAALLVVGQLVVRQARLDSEDDSVLRSLGMPRPQLVGVAGLRSLAIAGVGTVVAVALAVALSPLGPVGIARKAETNLGVHVDGLVLGLGALGVLVMAALVSMVASLRTIHARTEVRSGGRALLSDRMARAGLPPSMTQGVRLALESGRGASASPARSTIVAVALAVASVAAVVAFSGSLDRFLDSPRLYGWGWDAIAGDPFTPDLGDDLVQGLADDRRVDGLAVGTLLSARVAGAQLDVLATDPVKNGLGPVIADGRAPRRDDEIALGSAALADLAVGIGDRVDVRYGEERATLRIVGQAVLPGLAASGGLGEGAVVTFGAARRLAVDASANVLLVDAAPGKEAAVVRRLRTHVEFDDTVTTPTRPADLDDLDRVGSVPFVIGGVMFIVALATIVHGVVTSTRRRRRELAVLKTLGMSTGQLVRVVLWQATTIAAIALAVGIPLGVITGNIAWDLYATELGALSELAVSVGVLALLVPVVLLTANVVASVPGLVASRIPAAAVLRSE